MTSDESFFQKTESQQEIRRKAMADGREMGLPQDFGIFHGNDTPAHIKNQLNPLPTESEWERDMRAYAHDPLTAHFGQPVSIMALYLRPEDLGESAVHPDTIAADANVSGGPLMAKATPAMLAALWDRFFAGFKDFEQYAHPRYTRRFTAALKAECQRRGIPCMFQTRDEIMRAFQKFPLKTNSTPN